MVLRRSLPLLLLVSTAAWAPFQCTRKPSAELRWEEEPADALARLATRLRAPEQRSARIEVLRTIAVCYPSSRLAEGARVELDELGVGLGDGAEPSLERCRAAVRPSPSAR